MNKELIKNELQWLLEAINEQYEVIQRHNDNIPHLEFDILMENVRKFYENMLLLQRLNDPHFSYDKIIKPRDIRKIKQSGAQVSQEPGESISPEIITSPTEKEPASYEPKPVIKPTISDPAPIVRQPAYVPEPVERQTMAEREEAFRKPLPKVAVKYEQPAPFKPAGPVQVRHDHPPVQKKSAKPLEIDLFASEEPAFSIKLKDAREKTFSPKIPSERIENLKSAISINDKFMFINELFDGNLREYNETIESLNGFSNLDQAADFLDLIRKKNFWDTGSNAFRKLKELVERRF